MLGVQREEKVERDLLEGQVLLDEEVEGDYLVAVRNSPQTPTPFYI